MSAFASEAFQATPVQGAARPPREWLWLVPPPQVPLGRRSLPRELLEIWERALTAAETALTGTSLLKVFAPEELRQARRRLDDERHWLVVQATLARGGGY